MSPRFSSAFGSVPGSFRRRPPSALGRLQLGRAVEVAELEVEPAQAVEQPVMNHLVADLLGELEAFVEGATSAAV